MKSRGGEGKNARRSGNGERKGAEKEGRIRAASEHENRTTRRGEKREYIRVKRRARQAVKLRGMLEVSVTEDHTS